MRGKVFTQPNAKRLKAFALLVCALLLLPLVPAYADGEPVYVDLTAPCTVTLAPSGSDDAAFAADAAMAGVKVDLYLVAKAAEVPGYDTYTFDLQEPFQSLSIPEHATSAEWRDLANQAGDIIFDRLDTLTPAISGNAGEKLTLPEAGLYAVIAHGDLDPYVKTVGEGENARRMSFAHTTLYDYLYQPELIALPTKAPDANGIISTSNVGEWEYNLAACLKPERERRLGAIEVTKTLLTYNQGNEGAFVFEVTVELDGATLSRKAYSLSFTDAGRKSFRIEDLPAGAVVTVTEVYSGAVYKLITENDQTATIIADDTVGVGFTNDYTGTHRTGGSIENRFTKGEDGWEWSQHRDSSDS